MALLPEVPDILPAEWVYHGWTDLDELEQPKPASTDPVPLPVDIEGVATRIAALRRP